MHLTHYSGKDLSRPLQIDKLNYLVVGTGRCGTVFLAKLLSSVGIPCGHETFFQCDDLAFERLKDSPELPSLNVSWIARCASEQDEQEGKLWFGEKRKLEADSSYMAAPFLDNPALDQTAIIHVVRHPLKVINSFIEGWNYFTPQEDKTESFWHSAAEYHQFIYQHVPELNSDLTPIDKAAFFYVRWNEMIARKSMGKRYLRQRIEDNLENLFVFLDTKPVSWYNKVANKSGAVDKITSFDQISNEKIRKDLVWMAEKYGYPTI